MLRCKEVRLTLRKEKRASARLYPETYQKPKDPLRCILSCPTYAPDPAKRPTIRWLSPSSSTTWNLPLRLPAYQISHTTGYLKILKRRFFSRINPRISKLLPHCAPFFFLKIIPLAAEISISNAQFLFIPLFPAPSPGSDEVCGGGERL